MSDFVTGLTPNWAKALMALLTLFIALDLLREALTWAWKRGR